MVRNGHSVILFPKWLLSNITYGTKWLWCKIHMVRNGYGAKYIWYEMVSGYGTKLQFCGTKWQWYEMTRFEYRCPSWLISRFQDTKLECVQ